MIAKKSSGVPLTLGVSAAGIDFGYYSARLSKAEVRSKKAEEPDGPRLLLPSYFLLLPSGLPLRQTRLRRSGVKCDVEFQDVHPGITADSEEWAVGCFHNGSLHNILTDSPRLGNSG